MKTVKAESGAPLVSVVMPAYNARDYIEAAVRSVLEQTVTDLELIVIDDGSTDGTQELLYRLAHEDQRIRFLINEQNLGPARTRNRGFALCKGEYAALLDSDDHWHPEKLEKQLALARQTQADIVYCSYAIVNETGEKQCPDFIVPEWTDLKKTLVKSVISCSTALLTRDVYTAYSFPLDYYHEDYALWLQLLKDGKKARGIQQVLADYRITSNSRASNKLTSAKRRWDIYRLFMKMSMPQSAYYLARYAFDGVIKYRSV